MTLSAVRVVRDSEFLPKIDEILREAYPRGRTDVNVLVSAKNADFTAILEENEIAGFYFALKKDEDIFVLYLAVREDLRRKGCGTRIVKAVEDKYPQSNIVLLPKAPDVDVTLRSSAYRILKHLHSLGYTDSGKKYTFLQQDFEIVYLRDKVSEDEVDTAFRSLSRGARRRTC